MIFDFLNDFFVCIQYDLSSEFNVSFSVFLVFVHGCNMCFNYFICRFSLCVSSCCPYFMISAAASD